MVSQSNDLKQLTAQVLSAEADLGRECEEACGDAGYWDITEIAKVESAGRFIISTHLSKVTGLVINDTTPRFHCEVHIHWFLRGSQCYDWDVLKSGGGSDGP